MVEPRAFRGNVMSYVVLTKALQLAAAEIPVFPCAADKRPTCPHGFKDATCEPEAVRALWCDHPGPLIGVPTGSVSGIFVLDIDSAKHTEADEWLERHAPYLPETKEHRTQSGGLHILFKHRDGLKNSASRITRGIDTRGDGGYVVWWPAAIPQPFQPNPPLAEVPEWMVEALTPPPAPKIIFSPTSPGNSDDALPRLRGIVAAVATARNGERNCVTFWAACTIRDMLIAGELGNTDGEHAFAALIEASHRCGLPPHEIKRTLASATRQR
jgi:hypothetical protein